LHSNSTSDNSNGLLRGRMTITCLTLGKVDSLKIVYGSYEKIKVIICSSDAFKIALVREYQDGEISKNALSRKYGIGSRHAVLDWMCFASGAKKNLCEIKVLKISRLSG
jgi:hypothetical protein